MSNCAGSEPFALQVLGDSMAPEFPDGCVVVSEPGSAVHDGCYVIADYKGEIILRQLRLTASEWHLEPLNPKYPHLKIDGPESIRGIVIQRAGRRRADRQSYL